KWFQELRTLACDSAWLLPGNACWDHIAATGPEWDVSTIRAVEIVLDRLEENSRGRCTRRGWIDMVFAAMERRIERSARSDSEKLRDWWAWEGRAVMRAHIERVRAEGK